ncbi:hypothetical protein ACTXMG_00225 [Corynebacterium flavescens]|uniref:hypothetical protein n=1 Tax=Corynebacterium flavescens TaxID=28028 RepID=UPI003FCFE3B9
MSESLHDQLRRRRAAAARLEPIQGRVGVCRDPDDPLQHRFRPRPATVGAVADLCGTHPALVLAGGDPDLLREALNYVSVADARGELTRALENLERGLL